MKHYSTTQDDFEIFKESVSKYLYFFGLKSWEVTFAHNDRHKDARAVCEAELGPRHVCFTLTKSKWSYKPDERELRLLGFHEVIELMLTPISDWAEARRPEGDLNDITHNLIHTLENSVFVTLDTQPKTS